VLQALCHKPRKERRGAWRRNDKRRRRHRRSVEDGLKHRRKSLKYRHEVIGAIERRIKPGRRAGGVSCKVSLGGADGDNKRHRRNQQRRLGGGVSIEQTTAKSGQARARHEKRGIRRNACGIIRRLNMARHAHQAYRAGAKYTRLQHRHQPRLKKPSGWLARGVADGLCCNSGGA